MTMIALASFIVVTHDASSLPAVKQRVFEAVPAREHRLRHAPNLNLDQEPVFEKDALMNEQAGPHMAYYAITPAMASSAIVLQRLFALDKQRYATLPRLRLW